ncbi:cyclin-dependent kinase G-2-like [Chenopodium quinoa]|uniref:cyclin-dependent kinase G-2-like n=1 Tax=Chenopodium quinoa TaxID=63459 RepID=UPI000B78E484|nr:cyclin-dependent kinase G-2-like [Chenopodium quinoa]
MAAGRNGGYHETEYKERSSDYDTARRDIAYSKGEYDKIRNGNQVRDREIIRGRDSRARVRQRDIRERDFANGGDYRSSSSKSDSGGSGVGGGGGGGGGGGPRRCGNSARITDREPGELSSEDGSESAVDSESRFGKDNEVSKMDNGAHSSPLATKKRKFSPIVWDRDDKGATDASRSRSVSTTASLPPQPVRKSYQQSPATMRVESKEVSPVKSDEPHEDVEVSLVDPSVEQDRLYDDNVSESPANHRSSPYQETQWGNGKGAEQVDDEDYIPTRHISASRWAGNANSPADEGEISDDDIMRKKRKKMPSSEYLDTRKSRKSSSPDAGDGAREVSDVAKGRLSDSDGSMQSRPSTGDRDLQNNKDREDNIEVDDRYNDTDSSLSPIRADSDDEDYSRETPEPPVAPKRTVNMLQGCRSVDEFERLNKIDEGTYGVVYRAKDKKTGEIVALKKVKMEKEREGFPLTSLREINILLSLHHPSIVDVKEVVVGSNLDSIFMVMEYMEHDLKALMETMKQPFSQSEVKCLMLQLLDGIKYLHDNWVLHRDLKTSNLLMNNQGELKICDFGLARQYGSPLKPYTHLVVTLWYRSPELLLGAKEYSTAIDMWSLGCIMAELLSKEPLFNGKSEFDQLDKIFRILGTPNETIWRGFSKLPGVKVNFVKHQYNQLRKKFPATSFTGSPVLSDAGFDLLNRLLTYDPEKRITADAALNHEWFHEVPLPKSKEFMPTFPAQHAQDRRVRRVLKSPDPLEEQRRKELQQAELGTGGLFG